MIYDLLYDLTGINNPLVADIFGLISVLIIIDILLRFIFGSISRLFGG